MNYIKGYRYELHCIAKAAGEKHAVIWLLCNPNRAKQWNDLRRQTRHITNSSEKARQTTLQDTDATPCSSVDAIEHMEYFYSDQLLQELIQRYEPPDQRNRWDKPLYRVDVDSTLDQEVDTHKKPNYGNDTTNTAPENENPRNLLQEDRVSQAAEEALQRSVYNMHSLRDAIRDSSQRVAATSFRTSSFKRATVPNASGMDSLSIQGEAMISSVRQPNYVKTKMDDLIDEILDSFLLDVEPLKQGLSTRVDTAADANVLHDVDSTCQRTSTAFLHAQKTSAALGGGAGRIVIPLGAGGRGGTSTPILYSMEIKRVVQMVELRRLIRQYIKWISIHPPIDTSEVGIAKSFLSYVSAQL